MTSTDPHRRKVLVDASSAILLFKTGLFGSLTDTYAVQMATSVYREITCDGYAGAESFRRYRNRLMIQVIPLNYFSRDVPGVTTGLPSHFGAGERDTILLFGKGAGDFIIIDDGKGAAWCRDHKIPYINALLFPRILQAVGRLSEDACRNFLSRIVDIGRYSSRIIGFARSCDAHHLKFFTPDDDGQGMAAKVCESIKDNEMTRHDIDLFPLTASDFETLVAWITSRKQEVTWAGRTFRFPLDSVQLQTYLNTCRGNQPERLAFKAVDSNSGEMLGGINFHRIDWENRLGRLGLVIVSPRHRAEGIGAHMVKLALALGFETYGLHRIELGVFDFNFSAIRCYERCGFIREGVQRHACRYKNEYWNLVMMSMLRSEWSTRRF